MLTLLPTLALAATFQAEVDATPRAVPGEHIHIAMDLHWLEESMPTVPAFCVGLPPGWEPTAVWGDLHHRKGKNKTRAFAFGGVPADQLDILPLGHTWACTVGGGKQWRQGATGSVVFTIRSDAEARGPVPLATAVGRLDRSVHIGTVVTIDLDPSAPELGPIGTDPELARRVFQALDEAGNLPIEATSLAGQLTVRQAPPLARRIALAERTAARQSVSFADAVGPLASPLPGYEAAYDARRREAQAMVSDAATTWLDRTCDHRARLLSEPASPAHDATLGRLTEELEQLTPALAGWLSNEQQAAAQACLDARRTVSPRPVPEADVQEPEATDPPPTGATPE